MILIWGILTGVGLVASYTSVKYGLPVFDAFGLMAGGYGAARFIDNLRGHRHKVSHSHISNIKWGLQHGKEG